MAAESSPTAVLNEIVTIPPARSSATAAASKFPFRRHANPPAARSPLLSRNGTALRTSIAGNRNAATVRAPAATSPHRAPAQKQSRRSTHQSAKIPERTAPIAANRRWKNESAEYTENAISPAPTESPRQEIKDRSPAKSVAAPPETEKYLAAPPIP